MTQNDSKMALPAPRLLVSTDTHNIQLNLLNVRVALGSAFSSSLATGKAHVHRGAAVHRHPRRGGRPPEAAAWLLPCDTPIGTGRRQAHQGVIEDLSPPQIAKKRLRLTLGTPVEIRLRLFLQP